MNSARNVLSHKHPQETGTDSGATGQDFTKINVLRRIQEADTIFSLLSLCTRSPYVQCDPETFDDEIYLFLDEETAKATSKALLEEEKQPAGAVRIGADQKMHFFSSLFLMGVNAFIVKEGEQSLKFQLEELVKRRIPEEEKEGLVRVENPSLLLTALYYAQEIRRRKVDESDAKVRELQEEMLADFRRGTFIMAVEKETKNTPLMKVGEDLFHPVFTDIEEFKKFDLGQKFLAAVVPSSEIPKHIASNAKGVVLNPLGVNLVLNLGRGHGKPAQAKQTQVQETMQQAQAAQAQEGHVPTPTESGFAPEQTEN